MLDVKSAASKHCTTHALIVLLALVISSNETLLLFSVIVSDNAAMLLVTF